MSDFKTLKKAVIDRFTMLAQHDLYRVVTERDDLVEIYLNSFPEEDRQYFNCNCCKSFLRQYGNIVAIVDGKVKTMWEFDFHQMNAQYKKTSDLLHEFVLQQPFAEVFLSDVAQLGTTYNIAKNSGIKWEHFSVELPRNKVYSGLIPAKQSECAATVQVFERSLKEITTESIETVLELIAQNSLYRGEEFKPMISSFMAHKLAYDKLSESDKTIYVWSKHKENLRIRNTSIGTLLVDFSAINLKNVDLSFLNYDFTESEANVDTRAFMKAVRSFEKMVAPDNYKRPTAGYTPKQVELLKAFIMEMGYELSLKRRYAIETDIPVEQVLFVNRDFKPEPDIFDTLKETALVNPKKLSNLETMSLDKFITDVVPTAKKIEMLLSANHEGNFMALTAGVNPDAPTLFKWDSSLAWSYNGNVTDSMKTRVEKAGGNVAGELRFSIQWNEEGDNNVDFDAHAFEPDGHEIYFSNKGVKSRMTGMLDVDIINPAGKIAVENIIWEKTPYGKTELIVHNYSSNHSTAGFRAEIEYDGRVYTFNYNKRLKGNERVRVALINITKDSITFLESLESTSIGVTKEIWGIGTNKLHNVKFITHSPNHLAENETGNKHTFFILEGAASPTPVRGLYNEFLKPEFNIHRKAFDGIGDKIKIEQDVNQLAGLGFSSTIRNEFIVKVTGSFTRYLKITV